MKIDIEEIVALDELNMALIIREAGGVFDPLWRKKKLFEEIGKGCRIMTNYIGGELAGYLQYIQEDDDEVYILSIQIHPKYRNGITLRALIKKSLREITPSSIKYITSSVHRNNTSVIKLHRKLGFLVFNETKERVLFKLDLNKNTILGQVKADI
ncbi:GNAT family N-acetyltransferase [Spartinivicinus poritis]|uniref:GNAT family N-acetyltransferase n=1 Tax=Spartinivicinus poritis TaxID=2994640 RepID=A0ABT5UJY3_9GAMM|nr:GNAT family N-acetyltransferase [Spartinivicinus sp. A2-2]MDE1465344.1 GNAT family N-acetyltransferase [Spartinivicinus sp. A2-2]